MPESEPPRPATPEQVLALQQSAGNAAIARAIAIGGHRKRPVVIGGHRRNAAAAGYGTPIPAGPNPLTEYANSPAGPYGEPIAAPQDPVTEYANTPAAPSEYAEILHDGGEPVVVDAAAVERAVADGDVHGAVVEVDESAVRAPVGEPRPGVEYSAVEAPPTAAYSEPGEATDELDEDEEEELSGEFGEIEPYAVADMPAASPEQLDRALGQPGAVADAIAGNQPLHPLLRQAPKRNRLPPAKYRHTRQRNAAFTDEDKDSQWIIQATAIEKAEEKVKADPSGTTTMASALKQFFGWTDDDVAKYMANHGEGAKVDYRKTEASREELEVHPGATFTQGADDHTFTTKGMFSKFLGADFGIYAMAEDGRMYANAHRVGLFHHSSFLGGNDVAGAGEIKVIDGDLKHISNKSGHYKPGRQHMTQVLHELVRQGAALSGVDLTIVEEGSMDAKPYPGDAAKFYDQHKGLL